MTSASPRRGNPYLTPCMAHPHTAHTPPHSDNGHHTTERLLTGWLLLAATLLISSCRPTHSGHGHGNGREDIATHARLLSLRDSANLSFVSIVNPWDTTHTLARYMLVPRGTRPPACDATTTIVYTPLKAAAITSAVHLALLLDLGAQSQIKAMADTAYVISPRIKRLLRQGHIISIGAAADPDIERISLARPDALFLSPLQGHSYGQLTHIGIPLIECADYMETTPLGRAEWMRFYGRLFGRASQADSIFQATEKAYSDIQRQVEEALKQDPQAKRPTVFCDIPFQGTWYQPGGASTVAQMLRDAGADYLWASDRAAGSLPLDFEAVFSRAARADIWLIKYGRTSPLSIEALLKELPEARRFKAVRENAVYACNTLATAYYEEVPFAPQRLLSKWTAIFYPRALPHKGHNLAPYFKHL